MTYLICIDVQVRLFLNRLFLNSTTFYILKS